MTGRARCPGCDKPADTSAANRWRPFCSERCKLADLGQWFAERYSIPEDADDPADAASPERKPPQ